MKFRLVALISLFLLCIIGANYATERWGFVSLGFLGLSCTAGTFLAGATFTLRDAIQDLHGRWAVVGLILAGAGISGLISPELALASGTAFLFSEFVDFGVYTPIRRKAWATAVVLSAFAASIVDTVIFLTIAFGSAAVTVQSVAGQLAGKMLATGVVLGAWWVIRRTR